MIYTLTIVSLRVTLYQLSTVPKRALNAKTSNFSLHLMPNIRAHTNNHSPTRPLGHPNPTPDQYTLHPREWSTSPPPKTGSRNPNSSSKRARKPPASPQNTRRTRPRNGGNPIPAAENVRAPTAQSTKMVQTQERGRRVRRTFRHRRQPSR